jgi:tRNA(Arg) A34 adenosine deaminase TadA
MNDDYQRMLYVAIEEARLGLSEGGIPIGAALFDGNGNLLGRGHNRRIQDNYPTCNHFHFPPLKLPLSHLLTHYLPLPSTLTYN